MAKQQLRSDQGWIFDNFLMLSDVLSQNRGQSAQLRLKGWE